MHFPVRPMAAVVLLSNAMPSAQADDGSQLPPVIVTATRTAQTVDETLASVSVITRADIERRQAQSVPELLAGIAGVDVAAQGGWGKASSVFMRGTNSSHVLVLIDGIKADSATLGLAAFEHIPVSQIERIEIVRGPRSSLYGSEAIGGVIQIFTRKGREQSQVYAKAGVGSYQSQELSIGASGLREGTDYSISATSFKTDGFNVRQPTPGPFGVNELDKDGYRNDSLSLRLGHRFGSDTRIEGHLLRAQGNTKYDGPPFSPNQSDIVQQTAGVNLSSRLTSAWNTRLQFGDSRDEADNFTGGAFFSTFNSRRSTVSWQNDLSVASDQLLTLGVDWRDDKASGTTNYVKTSRDNTGIYLQHQAGFGKHDVLLGLRRDDNQAFGVHNTGNIAWGYEIDKALRITASYGTAFKTPTFNDLYFPDIGYYVGNPNLKPEESKSTEIGLRGSHTWGGWNASFYRTDIDQLIAYVSDPVTFKGTMQNVNRARINGFDAGASTELAGWRLAANLSLLEPKDLDTDKLLPRRAKQTIRFDADRQFGKAGVGLSWLAQGHRFDDTANNDRVAGYGILNLRAQYELSKKWTLRGKIDNVFDKQYQTVHTYNSPGRNVLISATYTLD
ncbi:MAG: TonB-dependent vitamin B12 receptor [Gammaproteobacteria bacterium]|nr:TonB-dependent vitamin B12 receptor [Gammaproteobacteria bacterium]